MTNKYSIILFILILSFTIVQARQSCNSCHAHVKNANREISKYKNRVLELEKELRILKSHVIHIGHDQMVAVYDNNMKFIGNTLHFNETIHIIGLNMRIVSRTPISRYDTIIYTDIHMHGVFVSLPPGRYNSSQISLPVKSISSIVIPENMQVVLYSNDNFEGNSIVLSNNISNLVAHRFNDAMVSLEIELKDNATTCNFIGKVYYDKDFNGKYIGLVYGSNRIDMSQISSIDIENGYEVLIYNNSQLIEIIESSAERLDVIKPKYGDLEFIVKHVDPIEKKTRMVLYQDINYRGYKEYIVANNKTHFSGLYSCNRSLSSLKIPLGLQMQVFDKPDFTGSSIIIMGEISNLRDFAFNDRMQSFIITQDTHNTSKTSNTTNTSNEQVILYSDPDYKGSPVYIPLGETICSIETNDLNGFCSEKYTYSKYYDRIHNNRASSIFVPNGYSVTLVKSSVIWDKRIYRYTYSNRNIRNWYDTPIVSILVEKI